MSAITGVEPEYFAADGEYEDEWELEGEWEATGPGSASTALLMEHLGTLAAESESEAEAEAFLGALVPLAAKLVPAIAKAAPAIVRGVAKVGGQLWRNPATRSVVRAIPQVVRRTTVDLARQYANGRPVTAQTATRALARQTANVLSTPAQRRRAVQRSRAMDRRWQQVQRMRATGRPVPSPVSPSAGVRPCRCM